MADLVVQVAAAPPLLVAVDTGDGQATVEVVPPPAVTVQVNPDGLTGPPGPPGMPGTGATYIHVQDEPLQDWVIDHPLPLVGSVEVVDAFGETVMASVYRVAGLSRVIVSHAAVTTGTAYLSS